MENKSIIRNLEKDYAVEDILHEGVRIIFILESPHTQELKYKAPVSGLSGKTMTKHILGERYNLPLGRVLKEKHGEYPFNQIGLMNVCQIPMQVKAYDDLEIEKKYENFFINMEKIRTSNQKDVFKEDELNDLQNLLVENLKRKIIDIKNEQVYFVPCGRFAQKFFRLADEGLDGSKVIAGVPHPSYNSWDKEMYREQIERVKKLSVELNMYTEK